MQNKVLITGSAVRVGAAIAESLAADGFAVAVHCHRSQAEGRRLCDDIEGSGGQASLVAGDLAEADSATQIFGQITGEPVTALIHNASIFERDTLESFSPETFRRHMRVHVEAFVELVAAFRAQLPEGRTGSVIALLDGMTGWSVSAQFLSYALSKETLRASIPLLAAELAPRIRVNGIALAPTIPGPQDDEGTFERLARRVPLKRTGEPSEVCEAVRYLLGAPGVTGQVIDLSGGMAIRFLGRDDPGNA